jgi:hypothetical protein
MDFGFRAAFSRRVIVSGVSLAVIAGQLVAQTPRPKAGDDPQASVPPLATLVNRTSSELADVVERFAADQQSLGRRYDANESPAQRRRMRAFYSGWRTRLSELNFDRLAQEGRVDYVLLDNICNANRCSIARRRCAASLVLLPADRLLLQDTRRDLSPINPQPSRDLAITHQVDMRTVQAPSGRGAGSGGGGVTQAGDTARPRATAPKVTKTVNRAAENLDQIKNDGRLVSVLRRIRPDVRLVDEGSDRKLDDALTSYIAANAWSVPARQRTSRHRSRRRAGGRGWRWTRWRRRRQQRRSIIGDPIGMEGLADLDHEMMPYTPEELSAIAEREYAFSLSEAKKAAREMGLGDDWKAAMEKTKNSFVEPGKQPEVIRDLARQAEAFFDAHDWVTIPPLAREDWRMEMMAADRQKVSPFFLGGEQILVSYPTADMSDEDKLMSMRGNNPHFSHATVFHELNPGHHLQGFMTARYNQHRRLFSTPFWGEGQSLYWEMFLWDHDFHVSPEDRMGALFWRMHRSARIIFSLNFHLGKMTPEQAIQFLVDTVAFERANAEGEVRRSFNGSYSPLYQAAYMLGGLELRARTRARRLKKMTIASSTTRYARRADADRMVRARLAKTC